MVRSGISGQRILVVDDEPLVCDSVRWMLAEDGHQVETAATGKAGLDLFRKGRFDLIVLDYELPGMNGDALAAAIKTLDPLQPIVMIAANAEALAASGNPLLGVDLVISKPFDFQEFRTAVLKLLTRS